MDTISPTAPLGAPPGPSGPRRVSRARSLLRFSGYTDQAALLLWVVFTSSPTYGPAALVRYALVGYFMICLVLFAGQTMKGFLRGWPTLILPVLCFISAIWAPSVSDAMRLGVFMFLTAVIPVYAATRLSGKQILTCYFLGEIYGAVLSVLHPNIAGGNWTGVFGQKNFLAGHMFIMYATGLPLLLDPTTNKWLRLAAAAFVPLGAAIVFFAHSATTLLLMIGSTGAIFAHAYVWQPASRIPMARTFLIVFLMVLTLLAATIAFGFMQLDAEKTLLNALGKDSTLTGRTFLWQIAHRVIDQHPWTGVGAVGFWRPEFGAANEITRYFDYENFTKFSFHNSYLENGVQFGYPGYYATYLLVAWGVWSAFRVWTRNQTLYNAVFMILALMVLIRSNAEVDLAGELAPTAILMFIGGIRRDPKGKPHPAFGELVSTMAQPPAPPPPPPPVEQPRGRFYPRPAPYRR